jgi:ABC-type cobalamin/Fe3+-siderophores transport system ATPase subunit
MNYDDLNGFSLKNLSQKNIILGKNGCGKSYLLKQVESEIRKREGVGKVRYISPERAGTLSYEPGIDQAITNNVNWMDDTRRNNQSPNFKQQSVTLYRRLELLTLREIEREHIKPKYQPINFQHVIDKINSLLDRIKITRSDSNFQIVLKETDGSTTADAISSGEAELISLAIEFLSFYKECDNTKQNFLLIDEPDVHLHPDLQDRLAEFISKEISRPYLTVIIASHSTSFIGALAREGNAHIAFMKRNDTTLNFEDINETQKRILPMFGAHPLSNIFNEAPILIVEGEDDERIWQQVVRSSKGKVNLYPCVAESIDKINDFEIQANKIIESVYDSAKGFSLRDRDTSPEDINDIGQIKRMRLSCRAAENLMLTDNVLLLSGTNWDNLQKQIQLFIQESTHHPYYAEMKKFVDEGCDRKNANLKKIRMVLAGFITNKPWEVLVGQSIAALLSNPVNEDENSLSSYLGIKVCRCLLNISIGEVIVLGR